MRRLADIARNRAAGSQVAAYRIGGGDLLEIVVFDLPELNRKVRVAQSGTIQLPLIGSVRAAGRSEADLAREIAKLLEKDYLNDPQVDVFVEEYRSQQVAVTGAVARPGLYPLTRDRYTILDMISEAGGLAKEAGAFVEFIPVASDSSAAALHLATHNLAAGGEGPGRADSISIDLNELLRGGTTALVNVPVAPGDVIFVPEAGTFTIQGWIDKPGTYPLGRNSTVLAALSAGGGPLFPARLSRVELLRNADGGGAARELVEVDVTAIREGRSADLPLRSGDVVAVAAWPHLVPPWAVYALFRDLIRIGTSVPVF